MSVTVNVSARVIIISDVKNTGENLNRARISLYLGPLVNWGCDVPDAMVNLWYSNLYVCLQDVLPADRNPPISQSPSLVSPVSIVMVMITIL